MLSATKVAVIIPCFNEARFIGDLVQEIRRILPQVIVVDDHSSDRTADISRTAGASVLSNDVQLGKGGSLLRGLKFAFAQGYEWALLMDGDGQHSPRDIPKFLAGKEADHLVIGNRMHDCSKMPWLRRTVNRWMSKRISHLSDYEVPDTQCGFRLLNLSTWNELNFQTSHFEIESEMVVAFAQTGHGVSSVPIEVIYRDEQSKISPWSDTIRWFQWYFRTRRNLRTSTAKIPAAVLTSKTAETLR